MELSLRPRRFSYSGTHGAVDSVWLLSVSRRVPTLHRALRQRPLALTPQARCKSSNHTDFFLRAAAV